MLAFPTETFYGLGCCADQAVAVARVYQAKRRPVHMPLPLLAGSLDLLRPYVTLERAPEALLTAFWPGPLTVVLTARLTPLARKRGQQIVSRIGDECEMFADPGKLAQVCYNIIENAIKYTPDGGTITVTLARMGRDAVLEISDTGVGIPAEDLPHGFDRFYRGDKARSRDTGGTGLGLSIVQQIIRLHAGSVTVQSELGKGTTFTVQLPVK